MEQSYHIPALLEESINGLNIIGNGDYVDVTFGGGGHSREILKNLTTGRLFAFDQDKDALDNLPDDEHFHFIHHNFRYLKNFMRYYQVPEVDGIIADLGVSFHDFDEADRGFSFRYSGKLDMRMNQEAELTASVIVNEYSEDDLIRIFRQYGEINNSRQLVKKIITARQSDSIKTTDELKKIVEPCVPKRIESKYLARVFQALRIETNGELDVLKEFLLQTTALIKPGGRLVVLTYHSLEDRLVKNFIRSGNFQGEVEKDFYGNIQTSFKAINRKVIIPGKTEIEINPRSRSAKLRIAERL